MANGNASAAVTLLRKQIGLPDGHDPASPVDHSDASTRLTATNSTSPPD